MADNAPVGVDGDGGVGHGGAEALGLAAAVVVVVGADDARLGGGVCVVEAGVGQQSAEGLHVGMGHGGGSVLDELQAVGALAKLVRGELQEHAHTGGYKEGGIAAAPVGHCTEEQVEVLQSGKDAEGGSLVDDRPHLGEAADVAEWTADNEGESGGEALGGNEVLGIGQYGVVADHDSLGLPGGAGGVENVGHLGRGRERGIAAGNLVEAVLWQVVLQWHGHGSKEMEGEVGDQEVGGLRSAQADYLAGFHTLLLKRVGALLNLLP